ncbi:hypothetical protein Tco_1031602 [Tanacetum coccineum]|uniref:Uncharacterized protein n=1 Tax=Tanacetum coccineum TaxID=301880 RepID=A0ABQ5G9G1_9ASTR
MKEHAYNIIKTNDSRTQRQSNLNKSKEARFKISPQEFKDHTLEEIVSLKYVCEHGSSESAGSLASREIVGLKIAISLDLSRLATTLNRLERSIQIGTNIVTTAGTKVNVANIDQDSTHMVAASKVPMLKPGEFEIWRMGIEQYIQMINYALWEVIENGATLLKIIIVEGVMTKMPITTAKEKA